MKTQIKHALTAVAAIVLIGPALAQIAGGGGGPVTQSTSPWVDNVSQFGGSNVVTGTGASGAGIPRVTISSDSSLSLTNPATIYSNQQTCTASAVALPSQALTNGVAIKALKTNTGTAYLGPSGVTTATGFPILAGDSISYAVTNLSAVFLICSGTTDVVAFTGN